MGSRRNVRAHFLWPGEKSYPTGKGEVAKKSWRKCGEKLEMWRNRLVRTVLRQAQNKKPGTFEREIFDLLINKPQKKKRRILLWQNFRVL